MLAKRPEMRGKTVVVVLPDKSDRYATTDMLLESTIGKIHTVP